jgi:ABC-type dipeptide/oligopeptide/nickel transport system permease subunit
VIVDPRAIRRFRKNKGALVGLVIVATITLFAVLGPLVARHSPYEPNFDTGRGSFGTPVGPSADFWFGTDTIFRDVFARLAHGGRLSLEVALAATVISMGIGTAVGVLSGYYKGTKLRIDHLVEGVGLSVAVGGGSLLIVGARTGGLRFLAFALWACGFAMALRLAGRALAIGQGRWRALGLTDVLDVAALAPGAWIFAERGSAALSDRRVLFAGLAIEAAALASRVLLSRREAARRAALPFARIDLDDALMRTVDVLLAFPFLLLLMAIAAAVDRTTESTIFLVLGLTAWTGTARVIRGKTLAVRELDYVVASRALGQSTPRILLKHVLPNVAGISIVLATNSVASMIVAEAALSFLGLSVPPPAASWGRMLEEGRAFYATAPWLLVAPSAAILLAVLGFNLLGEGLRDAFDPKDV